MKTVAARELRNSTRSVLERVDQGEVVIITIDGRPVARLEPVDRRPTWISREAFLASFADHQADPGLNADLRELAGDTTDDLPLPSA